ncbi:MAG: hypothetical protein IJT30_10270 [Muribaculaceae bacterium]|nr:hypothetical protein [Muribaculaceae bacterium]
MKKLFLFSLLLCCSVCRLAAAHVMEHVEHSGSLIYPGISYSMDIYVPEQYTGLEPACLYVGLDGVLCRAPQVMDSLIASGAMPVTIGVFLQPGVIKDGNGEVLRYNRSNQFDATDATFARFLETEVLPQVAGRRLADGRTLVLSPRGTDHMIFGLSSGGIAAFTAAWHRPDLFARVFSGVGTFVAMRGGNDLQAIVRKSEPRPIRVQLQDGSNDAWNPLFGHWYEGNQLLASALEFAGYDLSCDWSDGGHNVRRATEIFPQVMTWMWRDWPTDIKPGTTQNDLLVKLLIDGALWHEVETPHNPGAPAEGAIYPDSTLAVKPERGSNCLWQWVRNTDGGLTHGQRFYWLHSYDNTELAIGPMAFDSNGNLWVVTDAGIQICDQNGRVRGIVMLPQQAALASDVTHIIIGEGAVTLCLANGTSVARNFRVTPPTPGARPKSQGQG